jgi:hypothetical protein
MEEKKRFSISKSYQTKANQLLHKKKIQLIQVYVYNPHLFSQ